MNGFRITLGLLVLVLCIIAFVGYKATETTATAPITDPVVIENPYDFEVLPPRVIEPDAEEPLPIVPADDIAYDEIRRSFVRVESTEYGGSGVIVRPGIVVTNAHVVLEHDGDARRRLRVELLSGGSTSAEVIAYSTTYDLAVLRIESDFGTPATIAEGRVSVGMRLLAVGNPQDGRRIRHGNVLALDLPIYHDFVEGRTDTPVNMFVTTNRVVEGYSGGPMVDASNGVLYGITVGQVRYYTNAEGERIRVKPYAGVAMHIGEVMAEVDRLLAD